MLGRQHNPDMGGTSARNVDRLNFAQSNPHAPFPCWKERQDATALGWWGFCFHHANMSPLFSWKVLIDDWRPSGLLLAYTYIIAWTLQHTYYHILSNRLTLLLNINHPNYQSESYPTAPFCFPSPSLCSSQNPHTSIQKQLSASISRTWRWIDQFHGPSRTYFWYWYRLRWQGFPLHQQNHYLYQQVHHAHSTSCMPRDTQSLLKKCFHHLKVIHHQHRMRGHLMCVCRSWQI